MVRNSALGTRPTTFARPRRRSGIIFGAKRLHAAWPRRAAPIEPIPQTLLGDYLDIRGQQAKHADVYASDRYDASKKFGEEVRGSGGAGILYDSLRRRTGINVVAFRPRNIADIMQTDHFEIAVSAASRMIEVRKLSR